MKMSHLCYYEKKSHFVLYERAHILRRIKARELEMAMATDAHVCAAVNVMSAFMPRGVLRIVVGYIEEDQLETNEKVDIKVIEDGCCCIS